MKLKELKQKVKDLSIAELEALKTVYKWYGNEDGLNVAEQKKRKVVENELDSRNRRDTTSCDTDNRLYSTVEVPESGQLAFAF